MTIEPQPFSITRRTQGSCEIVALTGELDMASAPSVAETLDALVDPSRPVIVDLTELVFIDSSGIHAIVSPRTVQGVVALVCPPGNVQRVLSVTKLDRVLPLYETLDQALAGLA